MAIGKVNPGQTHVICVCACWIGWVIGGAWSVGVGAPPDAMPSRQHPWTVSHVVGSPNPPLPYTATRIFENVQLKQPTDVTWLPEANRFVATEGGGRIVSFPYDPSGATADLVLDLNDCVPNRNGSVYAILFHHDLTNHPWCFVTFQATNGQPDGTWLARFRVTDPTGPVLDPASMEILARWSSSRHAGGSMQFGPDGMFYVSVGDGQPPYPPDEDETGQDLSDLEASILRIDVDGRDPGLPYRIPPDNPFVNHPTARAEVWAFGYRNPWKIAFDPQSGDLLAADVGWEMRELVHRVERGRNAGWSLMEGTQSVKQGRVPAIPITPPLFEHTHLDSRSISGGYFWQSDRIPALKGAYLYGDWMTGKVWALKSTGDQVEWQQELVDTPYRVICFMPAPDGDVFVVGYEGEILRLDPTPPAKKSAPFPTRLSDTGLFTDVVAQEPAPGVVEYQINAHRWADGTHSRQWIGIPGHAQLRLYPNDDWKTGQTAGRFDFPSDTVVAKTVSYFADAEDPNSERRIETQLLHRNGEEWQAYNYLWNESQTDAFLQDDAALESQLVIRDPVAPGGQRIQTWRHASRSECLLCHIWAAGTVHAFWPQQLNLSVMGENQIDRFTRWGLFEQPISKKEPLVAPDDLDATLENRARSYLAMNCATCHRPQGGGTADFNFEVTKSLDQNNYIDAVPAQGTFGIEDARVVAAGDPCRSVLLYRTLKSGRGHMPQFGSNVIDRNGVALLSEWIRTMPSQSTRYELLRSRIADLGERSKGGVEGTEREVVDDLLGSVEGALALALACGDGSLPDPLRSVVIRAGNEHDDGLTRDLFEHFLPEDQRIERLGPTIHPQDLLAMNGSAESGRRLFEQAKDINCRSCHRVGNVGLTVGPDLSGIGGKQSPAEILASILRPSEKIDPKYQGQLILTTDGKTWIGVIAEETEVSITLVDSAGKQSVLLKDDVEVMQPATKSVMPEQLLSGMTAQQAADLLAFLAAQKTAPKAAR